MTKLAWWVWIAVAACGGKKDVGADPGGSASGAPSPSTPPPAAPPVAVIDAAVAVAPPPATPDAATPAEPPAPAPTLGAPLALTGALKGLVVRPFDAWTVKQKTDQVIWSSDCCILGIYLKPVPAKLATADDLKAEMDKIPPQVLVTSQVDEIVEHHDAEAGWWAIFKGPSATIPGDTNTVAMRVVHVAGKTFVCSSLITTGAGTREVRADEVVAACGTLHAK